VTLTPEALSSQHGPALTAATHAPESLLLLSAQLAFDLLSARDLHLSLREAMAQLGQATGVDRVYLFEYRPGADGDSPPRIVDQRYEWVASGIEPQIDNPELQGLDLAASVSRLHHCAVAGASFFADIHSFNAEERAILEPQGIQSLLIVPVLLRGRLWGLLGFDSVRQIRQWSASDEGVLRLLAATLAAAIEQHRAKAELRASRAQLDRLAHRDSLTGLPNRRQAEQSLSQALAQTPAGCLTAVLLLDIDQFKRVNDSLGHRCGDQLLVETARRLRQSLDADDVLARLGGDEFQIVLTGQTSLEQVQARAAQLCSAMRSPFALEQRTLFATISIGISIYPLHAKDADHLLQLADLALYRAKQDGRDQAQLFSIEMQASVQRALQLEAQVRRAVSQRLLQVHYQPRFDLRSGQINGAEALLRVRGDDGNWLHTGEVIALAESMGLIGSIGHWMIDEVCAQAARWRDLTPALSLAINVSARQFYEADLLLQFDEVLARYRLPADAIEVELTESTLMDRPGQALRVLQQLRQRGISRALDDFGSGYSSLSYLQRFPVERIKIDQPFVASLPADPGTCAIAASMADLAHRLGLRIVAEGVEHPAQLEFLKQHGYDEAQGYLLGRPMPASELEFLLCDDRGAAAITEPSVTGRVDPVPAPG
jgi:diguanylate cyclase (GGDEF)-like protein